MILVSLPRTCQHLNFSAFSSFWVTKENFQRNSVPKLVLWGRSKFVCINFLFWFLLGLNLLSFAQHRSIWGYLSGFQLRNRCVEAIIKLKNTPTIADRAYNLSCIFLIFFTRGVYGPNYFKLLHLLNQQENRVPQIWGLFWGYYLQ